MLVFVGHIGGEVVLADDGEGMSEKDFPDNISQVPEAPDAIASMKEIMVVNLRRMVVRDFLSRRYKGLRENEVTMLLNELEWRDVWHFDRFLAILNEMNSDRPKAWTQARRDFAKCIIDAKQDIDLS